MSNQKKLAAIRVMEAEAERRKFNRLKSVVLYPKQLEAAEATETFREIALTMGNQQGKSFLGAYLTAVHLTGLYPPGWKGRKFDHAIDAWACGESTVAVRDIQQAKLCGPPNDPAALGTGLIPKNLILNTVLGHGAGGAFDSIKVKHVSGGTSTLRFLSYEQGREKFQGVSLNWSWWDEEPPLELYTEGLARLIATDGTAFLTFTPLSGTNRVIPRFRERNAEAMRNRILIRGRLEDALHLQDPARRAALLATFPAHEREARLNGVPMLGSGAVFETPIDDLVVPLRIVGRQIVHRDLGPLETPGWAFLWALDFGIAHYFGAVLLAHDRDNDIVYALAEIKMRGAIPAQHAARMKAVAVNVKVAWPHDGNNRDRGSGDQLAPMYKKEGLDMLPSHATFAKGGYSTEAGIIELQTRMSSGRFKVAANLVEWQDEYQSYHRKDGLIVKENDDLLSATRIGVMAIRHAKPGSLGSKKIDPRGNGPQMVRGDGW